MPESRRRSLRLGIAVLTAGGLWASAAVLDATAASARTATVVVGTEHSTTWGTVLESGGHTLYTLKAAKSPCTAACLRVWPPLLLAKGQKEKAGKGVKHSMLGTRRRAHGVRQVTYHGKPLFRFVGDTGRGQANGNLKDAWGTWSVVVTAKPAGAPNAATTTSSAPKSSSTTSTSPAPHGGAPVTTTPPPRGPAPTTTVPKGPAPTTTVPPPTTTTTPPTTTTTTPPTTTTTSGGGPAF